MSRPNILLVMGDQRTPFMTSPYGHPSARTPAMEALAARGIVFQAIHQGPSGLDGNSFLPLVHGREEG